MDASITPITPAALIRLLSSARAPLVIDVRANERFLEATEMIRGALRRDPDEVEAWRKNLPGAEVVVYCVHGLEAGQSTAKALGARYLEGGIEAWRETGGPMMRKPNAAATRWITRERPKIDRIACPWLIRRFIDPEAEFLYVPVDEVKWVAEERSAIPFDIPEVDFRHHGERCSFDAFMKIYRLKDPALLKLAEIVRGADTGRLDLTPQSAGLAALSLGLSRLYRNDHEMLERGMLMYDALYASFRENQD